MRKSFLSAVLLTALCFAGAEKALAEDPSPASSDGSVLLAAAGSGFAGDSKLQRERAAGHDFKNAVDSMRRFCAAFVQEVYDKDGRVISKSDGLVALERPMRFVMYTEHPDRLVMYIKDKELHYYDDGIRQLSIFSMRSLESNPFMLLIEDDGEIEHFRVSREDQRYTLFPSEPNDVRSLTVSFADREIADDKGLSHKTIESLTLRMSDGNTNFYRFKDQRVEFPDEIFDVQLPNNIEIVHER